MDDHLVAVEVGGESLARQRAELDDIAGLHRQRHRLEGLEAVAVE